MTAPKTRKRDLRLRVGVLEAQLALAVHWRRAEMLTVCWADRTVTFTGPDGSRCVTSDSPYLTFPREGRP